MYTDINSEDFRGQFASGDRGEYQLMMCARKKNTPRSTSRARSISP